MNTIERFKHEHAKVRNMTALGLYSRRRPATLRAAGCLIHPVIVTEGWYVNNCRTPSSLPRHIRMQWALSRLLRGADKPITA